MYQASGGVVDERKPVLVTRIFTMKDGEKIEHTVSIEYEEARAITNAFNSIGKEKLMDKLNSLYRQCDRIGDKLANMELRNHDELTAEQEAQWLSDYAGLELLYAAIETKISEIEGV